MATTDDRKGEIYSFISEKKEKGESVSVSGLIDHLVDVFSDYSRREHLRFVKQELAGKEADEKEKEKITKLCPKCVQKKTGKKKSELDDDQLDRLKNEDDVSYAVGEEAIDDMFGWRFKNDEDKNTRPQSYCNDCRNS